MRAKQTDHRAVHKQGTKLLHEVKRKAGAFVGRSVQHSERRLKPRGEQRGRALPQQDRVPIGKGGVRRRTRPGKLAQICAAPGKAEHVDVIVQRPRTRPGRKPHAPGQHDAIDGSARNRDVRQQTNAFNDQTLLRHPHARAVAAYVQDVIRVHVRFDVMMGSQLGRLLEKSTPR